MEHMVTFKSAEGRDGHHSAKSLEDALKFVERLRNHEGASEVRLYRMQEVPIEFRAYYKVEVAGQEAEVQASVAEKHDEDAVADKDGDTPAGAQEASRAALAAAAQATGDATPAGAGSKAGAGSASGTGAAAAPGAASGEATIGGPGSGAASTSSGTEGAEASHRRLFNRG